MKRILLSTIMLFFSMISFSQISVESTPKSFANKDLSALLTATLEVEEPDLTQTIEYNNNQENLYKTRRFGVVIPLNVNFFEKADMAE
ncbi:MAG: hypothetical protein VB048_04795, partial [Bacteroidaceae bacterium]|nr:hypothetical protein [Bacteroidaceae bacterium]